MKEPRKLAQKLINQFLNNEGKDDYRAFINATKARQQGYVQAFGEENDQANAYVKTKDAELRNRLINGLFREMKTLGIEDFEVDVAEKIRMESPEQNLKRIEELNKMLRNNAFDDEFDKRAKQAELDFRKEQNQDGSHLIKDKSRPVKAKKLKNNDSKFFDRFSKGSRLKKRSAKRINQSLESNLTQAKRSEERALSAYEMEQRKMRKEAEREAFEQDR